MQEKLMDIAVGLIDPSPWQPRRRFDEERLLALAKSLKTESQLERILVRSKPGGRFELIFGERRLRAARLAKFKKIAARVIDVDDTRARDIIGIEVFQAESLSMLDQACYLQTMHDAGETDEQMAARFGKSRPWAANLRRLATLPEPWYSMLDAGQIYVAHARVILHYRDYPKVLKRLEADFRKHPDRYATGRQLQQHADAIFAKVKPADPPPRFSSSGDEHPVNGNQAAAGSPAGNGQRQAKQTDNGDGAGKRPTPAIQSTKLKPLQPVQVTAWLSPFLDREQDLEIIMEVCKAALHRIRLNREACKAS